MKFIQPLKNKNKNKNKNKKVEEQKRKGNTIQWNERKKKKKNYDFMGGCDKEHLKGVFLSLHICFIFNTRKEEHGGYKGIKKHVGKKRIKN